MSYLMVSEIWKLVWALCPSQVWGTVCTFKANGESSFSGRVLYFMDVCETAKTLSVSLFFWDPLSSSLFNVSGGALYFLRKEGTEFPQTFSACQSVWDLNHILSFLGGFIVLCSCALNS